MHADSTGLFFGLDTPAAGPRFATTRWPLVELAGRGSDAQGHQALAAILRCYLPPLRWHLIVRKRVAPDQADDLLQDFVADRVLAAGLLAKAVREKGKFRTFLIVALDHFLLNHLRHARAARRKPAGRASAAAPLDEAMQLGVDQPDLNHGFEVEWARSVLHEALDRMRDTLGRQGRQDIWELFDDRVVGPSLRGTTPKPYAELVACTLFQSPAQASNAALTGRRMFVRVLREVIGEYVATEEQLNDEIADLRRILSHPANMAE